MKFIGNKISYQAKNGVFSIVIAAAVQKSKEALLAAWLLSWTVCGMYFIYQLFGELPKEMKLYLVVLLTFWAYYEYRIIKVFLWRKYGYESIKFVDDKVLIRNVIKGQGKSKEYFVQNIANFSKLKLDNGFLKSMDNSFWIQGNGYIQFEYQGRLVTFGKQLSDEETKSLLAVVQQELINRKKSLK